ncbi:XK-related protein [Caerostris darwini]|uniref:XK-related protein n=1 Tax=Caerostris darwini TaxID=1538125 RepID=A0AAV4X2J2_9ARAC|nr:XK-related protein [Caerostris darwini]
MLANINQNENGSTTNGARGRTETAGHTSPGVLALFGRYSFPFLLASSVVKLSIYLNKLYQDSAAVGKYFTDRDINYCIVSAFCLFIPAILYIIYIVGAYVKDQEEAESKEVGTKVVHGLLLVPWQIKGRVEVLQFSAQRVCQKRPLTPDELEEKSHLERQAQALEFFEEFYAGLIQILLQLYIIIISLDGKVEYKALTGEIVASALTLMSMMAAVRRKDDGILTGFLSVVGWMSIMISRSVSIALATTVIQGWMILVCIMHAVVISSWVTYIAVKTYYEESPSINFTSKRKLALFFVIFSVFGLPSITYWPIMFELKKNKRPLIFLFILLLENVLFIAVWIVFKEKSVWVRHDYVLVFLAGGLYILGALFILFYICCKPKYTDQVVYHDMKACNADSFGMYFDFCDVAFKLARKQEIETRLKEVREHRLVPR